MSHRYLYLALLVTAAACNDDPAQPQSGTPTLSLVSGSFQTDTVYAGTADPLVVRVADARGRPVVGVEVIFAPTATGQWSPRMFLLLDGRELTSFTDTTDSQGLAAADIAFGGPRAGYAWIEVRVPETGAQDSAFYEILPGAPVGDARSVFPPHLMTAIGERRPILVVRRDQHGNDATVAPASCTTDSSLLIIEQGCILFGVAFGIAGVHVTDQGYSHTVGVPVLPSARLALPGDRHTVVGELGGGVELRLPPLFEQDWNAAGDQFVGVRSDDFGHGHLYVGDLNGNVRELLPQFAGSLGEEAPQFSSDGSTIFFHAWTSGDRSELWRAPVGGGAPERIGPAVGAGERYRNPSPSPDGQLVAFSFSNGSVDEIRILDLTTGAVSHGVPGSFPQWSPDGSHIAFIKHDSLFSSVVDSLAVMNAPSLTDVRSLGPAKWGNFWSGEPLYVDYPGNRRIEWSPDGTYLLIPHAVVRLADGVYVPIGDLPFGETMNDIMSLPAWLPD